MNLTFGLGSKSFLAIDPGRHTLKIGIGTLGVKGRSARLQSVYTVRTGLTVQNSPEEVIERTGQLIQEVLKRHNLTAKHVSFAIPGRVSFIRQLKIPKVSGDRLKRLIQYEARQQIPFPIEDIILDSHVFKAEGPELGVTLVAIRKTVINQYCDMLRTAGLVPDVIDVTTLSLFDAFYPQLQKDEEDMIALVDIGASTTDIIVCRRDKVEFIRSAPQAGDLLTKALAENMGLEWEEAEELKTSVGQLDPSIDRQTDPLAFGEDDQEARVRLFLSKGFDAISNEIRRTLDFYVSQPEGEPIGKIFLTGGTARCSGIAEFVESRIGVPCEVRSPFAETLVNVDDLETEPLETSAAILLGQCQREIGTVPLRLNFLPPAIVRRKEFERRRAILVAEGILLAILITSSVLLVKEKTDVFREATVELSSRLGGKGEIAKKINTFTSSTLHLNERFTILQEVGRNRGVISRTLAALAESLPLGESWLAKINMDTQRVILEVRGARPESVVAFKEKIQQVDRLRNPSITEEVRLQDGTISFKANAEIEKNPSPEIKKLREKLENRGVEIYELFFEDLSSTPGAKERFLVSVNVPEPLNEAERENVVLDILQAAADAELDYSEQNFVIYFYTFQRLLVGHYEIKHPMPEEILKGEKKVKDLTLIPAGG